MLNAGNALIRPFASEVLTSYLKQRKYPHWTSYFVKYKSVVDDQKGKSHFNWTIDDINYIVLRTGCWPFIKYHCTKHPYVNLYKEDIFFTTLKIINLGIPCLAYGVGSYFLIKHTEVVETKYGPISIYFLYKENPHSMY